MKENACSFVLSSFHRTKALARRPPLAVEGPQAISVIRAMLGSTNGREAPLGTIRGDLGLSRQMNLVHGSDGPEAAARELAIYFKPEELIGYSTSLDPWTCAGDEK